ncbi:hypothetical protein [Kaarinaea lacus]
MQRKQADRATVKQPKQWLDVVDLELMFINAIVVCALVLVIVAADILMS